MFKSLFKKERVEIPEISVEVPVRAVEVSSIDPRLIVKTGKRGKTIFLRSPCIEKCADCPKQFTLNPPDEDGKTFCLVYPDPEAMWAGLNFCGEPKTCLAICKPKAEKEGKKLNPLKASKRGMRQTSPVASVAKATGSKESAGKKKKERRDSR